MAVEGNQFWKKRSKHGRDAIFTNAATLWDAACEYFEDVVDNPLHIKEAIKSGDWAGTTMNVPTTAPFTLAGLCLFLGVGRSYWRQFKASETAKAADFSTVIEQIEDVMFRQKFEGAAIGVYKENLISRELGLADKVDANNTNINFNTKPMTPERAREIGNMLESEF